MTQVWPGILINGAVVVFLWGLVWRNQELWNDRVQGSFEKMVERDYCRLNHEGIREDVQEIKDGLNRMGRVLEDIRIKLARENGRRRAAGEDRE